MAVQKRKSLHLIGAGIAGVAMVVGLAASGAQGAEFTPLGFLPEYTLSSAADVSADGCVAVGLSEGRSGTIREAFQWTEATGMTGLGFLPGGYQSGATGINADGSVIVGWSNGTVESEELQSETLQSETLRVEAFRWTQATGMVGLGVLPYDTYSRATGVNADGSVVVGDSGRSGINSLEAFRWTEATGMVGLGGLYRNAYSRATGVNADGSVVVGESGFYNSAEAFRWTQATGMIGLGFLTGDTQSTATDVNADGSVVVGQSFGGVEKDMAFRWTQATGMVGLGFLPGHTASYAYGVNNDGAVVVGSSWNNESREAFRWTQATGMESIADWLAHDGLVLTDWQLHTATAVNADGSVIVGDGISPDGCYEAWLARAGSGLISPAEFSESIDSTAILPGMGLNAADLILHGIHGHPLQYRPSGRASLWVSGDWGSDTHGSRDGSAKVAEVGGAYVLTPGLQLNLGIGKAWNDQDLSFGGEAELDGFYGFGELMAAIPGTPLVFTFGGDYLFADADVRRGYMNAGNPDSSSGSTDVHTYALRVRLDWENALSLGSLDLTPYGEFSYLHTRVDGYTESGGGFPVSYNNRKEDTHEMRYGVNGVLPLSEVIKMLVTLEGVHRFDTNGAAVTGQVIGLSNFDLPGVKHERNWLRASLGAAYRIENFGTISLMLNSSTKGEDPAYWAGITFRYDL